MKIKIKKRNKILKEALFVDASEEQINRALKYADVRVKKKIRSWELMNTKDLNSLDSKEKIDVLSQINDEIVSDLINKQEFGFEDTQDSFVGAIKQFLKENPMATVGEAIDAIKEAGEEFAPKGGEAEEFYLNLQNPLRSAKEILDLFKKNYKIWFFQKYGQDLMFRSEEGKKLQNALDKTIENPLENTPIKNNQFFNEALSFISKSDMDEKEEKLLEQYKILEMEVVPELPKIKLIKDKINKLVADHKKKNIFTRNMFIRSRLDDLEKEYEEAIKPLRETALIILSYAYQSFKEDVSDTEDPAQSSNLERIKNKAKQIKQEKESKKTLAYQYAMAEILADFRAEEKAKFSDKKPKVRRGDINKAFHDIKEKNHDFHKDLERGAELLEKEQWFQENDQTIVDNFYKKYLDFENYQRKRKERKEATKLADYFNMSLEDFNDLSSEEKAKKTEEYYYMNRMRESQINPMKIIMENWRKNYEK